MKNEARGLTLVIASIAALPTVAAAALPPPTSPEFCVEAQKFLATTQMTGQNTVFTAMAEYRHSKPAVEPLQVYQVVTYTGTLPIMVSCKVKTAAHLRAAYGEKAAGEQRFCPELARRVQADAVERLRQSGQAAAAQAAAAFVIDDDEPYLTGRSYLADFELSHRAADGRVHLRSPGLFQDYDAWYTALLPAQFQGQSYCHLATVDYLAALAGGTMQPGTVVTTADDAPVTPK
jgi:hypothetical protein